MNQPILVPRPAATLILVRDIQEKMEVFMVQRSHQAAFLPGGHVFPGGAVDPSDFDPAFEIHCPDLNDESASQILQIPNGGLAYWIAALRECFEEAGLLMAYDESGKIIETESCLDFEMKRKALEQGQLSFLELCRKCKLTLAFDRLTYFAHWITHVGAPRRFDARFFAAVAPGGQTAAHDNSETISHIWIDPALALERHQAGEMKLAFATIKTLEMLSMFDSTDAFMEHVRNIETVPQQLPKITN